MIKGAGDSFFIPFFAGKGCRYIPTERGEEEEEEENHKNEAAEEDEEEAREEEEVPDQEEQTRIEEKSINSSQGRKDQGCEEVDTAKRGTTTTEAKEETLEDDTNGVRGTYVRATCNSRGPGAFFLPQLQKKQLYSM